MNFSFEKKNSLILIFFQAILSTPLQSFWLKPVGVFGKWSIFSRFQLMLKANLLTAQLVSKSPIKSVLGQGILPYFESLTNQKLVQILTSLVRTYFCPRLTNILFKEAHYQPGLLLCFSEYWENIYSSVYDIFLRISTCIRQISTKASKKGTLTYKIKIGTKLRITSLWNWPPLSFNTIQFSSLIV